MIAVIFSTITHSILDFFVRWYGVQSRYFWSKVSEFFASLDQTFGIVVNARLLLKPLYGDYSPVGRIIGPIFRVGRVVLGSLTYTVLFAVACGAWVLWLSIPILFIVTILVPHSL